MGDRWVEFVALKLGFVKKVVEVALVETIAAGIERMSVAAVVVLGERDFAFELFAAHIAQIEGAGYAALEVQIEVGVEVGGAVCSIHLFDLECVDLVEVQAAAKEALGGVGFDQQL